VKLKEKVEHQLNESRMLIMGVQVLLAFNFQVFLMRRFDAMPPIAHHLKLGSTALLLLATLLLIAPAAHHQLVEHGTDSRELVTFTRRVTAAALFPFAISLGVDFFVVVCLCCEVGKAPRLRPLGRTRVVIARAPSSPATPSKVDIRDPQIRTRQAPLMESLKARDRRR
jgi:hypothetical protein